MSPALASAPVSSVITHETPTPSHRPRFTIGDFVVVHEVVMFRRSGVKPNENRECVSVPIEPKHGQIVGMSYKQVGQVGEFQASLKKQKAVPCWLVRTGLLNRPFLVLDQSAKPVTPFELPVSEQDCVKLAGWAADEEGFKVPDVV